MKPASCPWERSKAVALRVREHVVRMASGHGCFVGASLSCVDLFVHLYTHVMNISANSLSDPNRDYLLLSKGHAAPALYGTLAEIGVLEPERLSNHLCIEDSIYWHPSRQIPGVEFHSGSLGHMLSVGIGIAMDAKLRESQHRVFVVLGDGELNEGSVWEALLVACAHRLDNLVCVVDRNHLQANMHTEALIPLEPLAAKFEAFGARVEQADGHDFASLERAFQRIPIEAHRPSVVIAATVRGKGIPTIEGRADRWFLSLEQEPMHALLRELHQAACSSPTAQEMAGAT